MKRPVNLRPVNIFYGHVLVGLFFTALSVWGATQYVAYALGYQSQLGNPCFYIGNMPIYLPWSWFFWAYQFEPYAPWVFDAASWITYGSFFLMFSLMVVLAIRRAKRNKNTGAYGTARWADIKELQDMGLVHDDIGEGVVLAQTNDAKYKTEVDNLKNVKWVMTKGGRYLLIHNGPEHVLIFAPTRSGKGVGLVIPTLVNWFRSALIIDIKKENWYATSGFRSKFSHCLLFEPASMDSVRFNPLSEVRMGPFEVRDVQNIADILVDPEGSKERLDHWEKTGHSLLVGVILHVIYSEDNKTLEGVASFLANPKRTIFATLKLMLRTKHLGDRPHNVVASCAREMLNKSENELSGVVSTAMSFLGLYRDPIIARNTSFSDFRIADLMNAERPVSLYVVIPPSDLDRIKPLIRLFLNQIGRRLTERMEPRKDKIKVSVFNKIFSFRNRLKNNVIMHYKHRLLLLMDEFPALGRLGFFESELAYLAGYGIKCVLIAQSLNQIEGTYTHNNSILDNTHVRITFGANDERTAKRISDLLGQGTEYRRQLNFAGNRLAPWLGHLMASEQESPRQLLTPGEVLQLPGDEAIVMVGNMPPYLAKKIMFYQDERFSGRVGLDCPSISAECVSLGSRNTPFLDRVKAAAGSNQYSDHECCKASSSDDEYSSDPEDVFDDGSVSHAKQFEPDTSVSTIEPDEQDGQLDKDLSDVPMESHEMDSEEDKETEIDLADDDVRMTNEQHKETIKRMRQQRRLRAMDIGDQGGLPL